MRCVVAFIHARKHSERFPGKHFAEINGVPLIEHVMHDVVASQAIHDVVVSSDDPDVLELGGNYGFTLDERPAEWCDETKHTGYEVYRRSVDLYLESHPEVAELIAVGVEGNTIRFETGPNGIIDRCVHALIAAPEARRAAAVTRCDHDHPCFARRLDDAGYLQQWGAPNIQHNSRSFAPAYREACLPLWRAPLAPAPAIPVEIDPWAFCHVHTEFDLHRAKWLHDYHHAQHHAQQHAQRHGAPVAQGT